MLRGDTCVRRAALAVGRRQRAESAAVPSHLVWLSLTLLCAGGVLPAAAEDAHTARVVPVPTRAELQTIVDTLRDQLAIHHEVIVEIVPSNARLVSVARNRERFDLAVEGGFFETLTPTEREAVLAHELGHVWIFTNHPYLQTEQLANRIAMRVVSRESLASVYEKMWARSGAKGDLARFLGEVPESQSAGVTAEVVR